MSMGKIRDKILTEEKEIIERWQGNFQELLNGSDDIGEQLQLETLEDKGNEINEDLEN